MHLQRFWLPIDEIKNILAAELSTDTTQHYLNQIGTRPFIYGGRGIALRHLGEAG